MSSVLKCPSCHHPLSCAVEVLEGRKVIYVYCGFGLCQPAELGDGVPGSTTEESFRGLNQVYRDWLEMQPE